MDDRKPTVIQATTLHLLTQQPDARVLPVVRQRLESHGWLTRRRDSYTSAASVTDSGRDALARAVADPPLLDAETARALAVIGKAGPEGLHGYWPGTPTGLNAARLFALVRSNPPDVHALGLGTYRLTEAGERELHRYRRHARKAPMSEQQAHAVRAVAIAEAAQPQHASDLGAYLTCHDRGWLKWATYSDGTVRREVTAAGWLELIVYYRRRDRLPIHLPVRALATGHIVRLSHPDRTVAQRPVPVARLSKVTHSGRFLGHVVLTPGPRGLQPYPDQKPLPPETMFEVFDYQPATTPPP